MTTSSYYPNHYAASFYAPATPYAATTLSNTGNGVSSLGLPAGPQGPSGASSFAQSTLQKSILSNGTPGYFLQTPGAQKSAVLLAFPLAALPPELSGLLCSLLTGGSPSTKRQMEALERQGIQLTVSSNSGQCTVQAEAPVGKEADMLSALQTVLTRPVVDPATFNTLKSQFKMAAQSNINNLDAQLENRMAQRLFGPNHPVSKTPQAAMAEYDNQTLSGVMAYQPALLQLLRQGQAMMVSPLPADNQRQLLDAAVSQLSLNASPAQPSPTDWPPERMAPGLSRPVLLPTTVAPRAMIKVLWQAPDQRDPDFPAFTLIDHILNSSSTYSFFNILRTRDALVYGMKEGTPAYRFSQGQAFSVGAEVDFPKITQALNDIRELTQALCQGRVSAEELQAAQRTVLLGMRQCGETSSGVLELYSRRLSRKGAPVPSLDEVQAALNRVTLDDIQRVANRIFNNPNSLSLLGVAAPLPVLQQTFPGQPLESV